MSREPHGPTDLLAVGVIVAGLAALRAWFAIDARPPVDLGHYYQALPLLWAGQLDASHLLESGGLYNLLLTGLMRALGRSAAVLEGVETAWLALLLVAGWRTARAMGGRAAGLWAVSLLAMMPLFQVGPRTHWLHFIEAAALTAGLWAWSADPGLARRRTPWLLAGISLFALLLRPTGLLFAGPLVLAAVLSARDWRARLPPLLGLGLGALALTPHLQTYLAGKVAIRAVYAQTVRPLLPSLAEQSFMLPGLLLLLGLLLAWRRLGSRLALLLLSWAGGAALVAGLFHVGVDNFPLLFLSAALLAALGLPRALAPVGVLLAAVALLAPFLPPPVATPLVPALGPGVLSFEPTEYLRPQSRALDVAAVRPQIDAVCAKDDGVCTILSTTGPFDLNREDDASLALFLGQVDGVKFRNGGQFWAREDLDAGDAIEGLLVMDCPKIGVRLNRFLERERAVGAMAQSLSVQLIAELGPPAPCPQRWYRLTEPHPREAIRAFAHDFDWRENQP